MAQFIVLASIILGDMAHDRCLLTTQWGGMLVVDCKLLTINHLL